MMIVAKDGSGDYTSVQAAIDAIPDDRDRPVTIKIRNGVYKEKVILNKSAVTLIGEDAEQTIITYDDHAKKLLPNGEPYGTFKSHTVFVGGCDVIARNLTFVNSSGRGEKVGQALAAYVDGDRVAFYNCRFLGRQDTLFTGPLPPKPKQGGSFGSPRDGSPRSHSRQYYEHCYIEGDVDFIFGSATAVFRRCEIFALTRDDEQDEQQSQRRVHGYITAASTAEGIPFGYVFIDCQLKSNAPAQSYYLGRPWRDHAKTVFISCWMGEHIIESGWHNWRRPEAERTTLYGEYQSEGPGASSQRCSWSHALTAEQVRSYEIANMLSGEDKWMPEVNDK